MPVSQFMSQCLWDDTHGYYATRQVIGANGDFITAAEISQVFGELIGLWAGIVWQDPANDWGDQPGGFNLTGAKKLKFWARGDKGGESVSFKFGVLGTDKKYSDSATGAINDLKLTKEWTEYSIDLAGKDLARIKTGFVWTVDGQGSPVVFFLDDIRLE